MRITTAGKAGIVATYLNLLICLQLTEEDLSRRLSRHCQSLSKRISVIWPFAPLIKSSVEHSSHRFVISNHFFVSLSNSNHSHLDCTVPSGIPAHSANSGGRHCSVSRVAFPKRLKIPAQDPRTGQCHQVLHLFHCHQGGNSSLRPGNAHLNGEQGIFINSQPRKELQTLSSGAWDRVSDWTRALFEDLLGIIPGFTSHYWLLFVFTYKTWQHDCDLFNVSYGTLIRNRT